MSDLGDINEFFSMHLEHALGKTFGTPEAVMRSSGAIFPSFGTVLIGPADLLFEFNEEVGRYVDDEEVGKGLRPEDPVYALHLESEISLILGELLAHQIDSVFCCLEIDQDTFDQVLGKPEAAILIDACVDALMVGGWAFFLVPPWFLTSIETKSARDRLLKDGTVHSLVVFPVMSFLQVETPPPVHNACLIAFEKDPQHDSTNYEQPAKTFVARFQGVDLDDFDEFYSLIHDREPGAGHRVHISQADNWNPSHLSSEIAETLSEENRHTSTLELHRRSDPLQPSPAVLAEISTRRNAIELGLRQVLGDGLKFAYGPKAAAEASKALPESRRESLSGFAYRELWPNLYFSELRSILDRHWLHFQRWFSSDKQQVLIWLDQVNRFRIDAHALSIGEDDLAFLRSSLVRLEEHLELA